VAEAGGRAGVRRLVLKRIVLTAANGQVREKVEVIRDAGVIDAFRTNRSHVQALSRTVAEARAYLTNAARVSTTGSRRGDAKRRLGHGASETSACARVALGVVSGAPNVGARAAASSALADTTGEDVTEWPREASKRPAGTWT
jgi:hypothetical protein